MVVAYGEAHHLKRYPRYPRVGLLVEKELSTDALDLQILREIFCRTAINFKTRLEFALTSETPIANLTRRITTQHPEVMPLPARLQPTSGVFFTPPSRLALFNGSPRGHKGNTPVMLAEIARGFGKPAETYHLVRMKETGQIAQAFSNAECAILGFPLYTDAMPAVVKHFIEALEPFVDRPHNPPLGFLVQSGFPEGLHSRYIERYLEKLADRLGSPYLGTVVKGNGEGLRSRPAETNRPLFSYLQALGAGLLAGNPFDPSTLAAIASPEAFSPLLGPVFQVFLRLPIAHQYFDNMLEQNGVFEKRFARPFLPR